MSDLLKNAIADAKAVRATALANAKAALEEAFAPKLQSMLSEKLKAELGEEEVPAAPAAPVEMEPVGLDGEAPAPEAEAPMPAPEVHADAAQDAAMMNQAPEVEMDEMSMEEYHGLEEGEKASDDYKKTTNGHKTDNKGQEMVDATKLSTAGEPKAAKGTTSASSDYKKTTAGHNTEDPQGASNELSKGQKKNDSGTSALKENDAELDNESLEEILKELEASVNDAGMDDVAPEADHQAQEAGMDEEINLDELLSETSDEDADEEKVEEGKKGKIPPQFLDNIKKKKEDGAEKEEEDEKETVKENLSLKKELAEYRSAVKYLRDQINEVNLLNAKLLYTNKLFKQANLNNEQKLKVIESFDLTKSVREAKIVYATLAESFNFSAKKAAGPVKASTTIKTITEGLASKAVASTRPTKPTVLVEGAEMANRFKKLAGIRK